MNLKLEGLHRKVPVGYSAVLHPVDDIAKVLCLAFGKGAHGWVSCETCNAETLKNH